MRLRLCSGWSKVIDCGTSLDTSFRATRDTVFSRVLFCVCCSLPLFAVAGQTAVRQAIQFITCFFANGVFYRHCCLCFASFYYLFLTIFGQLSTMRNTYFHTFLVINGSNWSKCWINLFLSIWWINNFHYDGFEVQSCLISLQRSQSHNEWIDTGYTVQCFYAIP